LPEATPEFKRWLGDAFGELDVGRAFIFRRTFTKGDVALFRGVTGDSNPDHLDEELTRESRFGRRIVPGLLTDGVMTHTGGLLGFLATEMSFRYLPPVYIGDTVTCSMTLSVKDKAKRRIEGVVIFTSQDGAEGLRAWFAGFPVQVRLAR
jgi:acyl dehydratase